MAQRGELCGVAWKKYYDSFLSPAAAAGRKDVDVVFQSAEHSSFEEISEVP